MKIGIIGCGWLGLPLGKFLVKKGFEVNGSSTHSEKLPLLETVGINPFLFELNPQVVGKNVDNLLNVNALIINIPPKLKMREPDFHFFQLTNLLNLVEKSSIEQLIFISSTSVYPELNREVFEEDVTTPQEAESKELVKVENLLQDFSTKTAKKLTILRCGGLMGYDRIPAKYFAGWKGLTTGEIPVNYIHRDDVIGIIHALLIEQDLGNETFNLVSPIHPIRKEIYEKNCQELGFELPEFITPTEPQPFKIVSSKKIVEQLNYQFIYANPLQYKYAD